MDSLEISHLDLEFGERSDWDSVCFSDAEEGSCITQFFSTYGGSYDDHSFVCGSDYGISDSRRLSSAAVSDDCSIVIDGETMIEGNKVVKVERDCRICHLTLDHDQHQSGIQSGIAIHLGCSCKDDLGAAHKQCAEAWFKIKGNTTCEICNSIAVNVFGENQNETSMAATQQQQQQPANASTIGASVAAMAVTSSSSVEERRRLDGQKLVNILLACMVFAFVVSWLFHFNIPS
ncbi:uncharacterized protein LOC124920090 [Impatiens glandulifera]|uniref:uncharacterized protein LOC124920090 n=1 Tax=Impatiens glandulifera TaxID=253017 RepID=UPI001FB16DF0|nr:uncharacterized protein LOC124920090 [Impatiens glandulifera]